MTRRVGRLLAVLGLLAAPPGRVADATTNNPGGTAGNTATSTPTGVASTTGSTATAATGSTPVNVAGSTGSTPTGMAGRTSDPALDGDWVFNGKPGFPGVALATFQRDASGWSGTLTTAWYGPQVLGDIVAEGDALRFGVGNGNPRLPPQPWTARLNGGRLELSGRIWNSRVDVFGHRGSAAEVQARQFALQTLPPMRPLSPNGLARTPPMGWSSWNRFADRIDDRIVRQVADAMVRSGLRDAGYVYVNIDDGWQGARDADGAIHPNRRFPDMRALADYLHARGLKLGLYSSPGPKTCAGYTGSYGHVAQDARSYAGWGVDFLKYDLCSGEAFFRDADAIERAYDAMGQALRASGRPIMFSLCEYGREQVGRWGRKVGGHLWRTSGDIENRYSSMAANGFDHAGDPADSGPGGWNDPDMLEIGNNGLGPDAERTHLSLWALDAAPLILGNDPRHMDRRTRALLSTPGVIAIDQDPGGIGGRRVRASDGIEVWRRPLANGRVAVGLFNRGAVPAATTLAPSDAGLDAIVRIRDAWTGRTLAPTQARFEIAPEGVKLLLVSGRK